MRQLQVGPVGSILSASCCEGAQVGDIDSVTAGFSVSISLCNCLGQFFFFFAQYLSVSLSVSLSPWKQFHALKNPNTCMPPSAKFQLQQIHVWRYAL